MNPEFAKVENPRRYFRVITRELLVKTLLLFNAEPTVIDIGVSLEDSDVLVSYTSHDGPIEEGPDLPIHYNHLVSVSPFFLAKFVDILEDCPYVGNIQICGGNTPDEIMVAYLYSEKEDNHVPNTAVKR